MRESQGGWDTAIMLEYPNYPRVEYCGNHQFSRPQTHGQGQSKDNTGRPETTPCIAGAVRQILTALQWVLGSCSLPEDEGKEIAELMIQGRGKCMSNRLVKDKQTNSKINRIYLLAKAFILADGMCPEGRQ